VSNGVLCVQDESVPVGDTYKVLVAWAALADVTMSAATSVEDPRKRKKRRRKVVSVSLDVESPDHIAWDDGHLRQTSWLGQG
jgi:hypothetical protein